MNTRDVSHLLFRYLLLIILGIFISFIYLVFTYLTVYPVYWILGLFDSGTRLFPGSLIFFDGFYAEIAPACVAGAAYYLLLILNLTTPMRLKTRIRSISFVLLTFLVLNILRIVLFAHLYGSQYFASIHLITWYIGSTLMVVGIWFVAVKLFAITEIPVYTDILSLVQDTKGMKR